MLGTIRQLIYIAAGIAGLVLALGIILAVDADPVVIYLDNGSGEDVRVTDERGLVIEVAAHDVGALRPGTGAHQLTARRRDGRVVDEVSVSASRGPRLDGRRYIFNIDGQNQYALYTVDYGHGSPVPPAPVEESDHVFAIPDEIGRDPFVPVGDTFLNPPPARQWQVGTEGAEHVERRLYHRPIHRDRRCCRRLF